PDPDKRGPTQLSLKAGDDAGTRLDPEGNEIEAKLNFTLTRQKAGLANPASVNCVKLGGTSVILQGAKGAYGMCRFGDGRECEEWALLREGKCLPHAD